MPATIQIAPQRWLVHAQCPGCHDEQLPSTLAAIEESLAARHVERAQVRVDCQLYRHSTDDGRGPK
jgi:hypothetical protein